MTYEKNKLYNRAAKEVYMIITYMSEDLKSKIPNNVKEKLRKNMDKNYFFEYNINLSLDEQNLMTETRDLLSIIYSNYLCSENERQKWNEYDRFIRKKEEEIKRIKFQYKGFNTSRVGSYIQEVEDKEEKALIKLEKINIFQRIIDFLKSRYKKRH